MRGFDAAFVARYRERRAAGLAGGEPGGRRGAAFPAPAARGPLSLGGRGDALVGGNAPLRVVGIDTSLRCTGLAALEDRGEGPVFLDCRPVPNPAKRPLPECLVEIADRLVAYLDEWAPDEIAMEGIFFCKNARTSLILGHARGVVVAECARRHLPVHEYPPARVKRAVTGTGAATKDQMRRMMQAVFRLPDLPQEDSADALAIAMTHLHQRRLAGLRAR